MRIAVASGKGGTGKTTVAAGLALSLDPDKVVFLDCDVEAPNARIFLDPVFDGLEEAGILTPRVDVARCIRCGRCAEVCRFNALAVLGEQHLIFPELCHGCGSCLINCPEQAISEYLRVTGVLETGRTPSGMKFAQGVLNVGEPMAVPIIRALKAGIREDASPDQTIILDAPPGASCPVVETLRGVDCVLLVTEPTPFGVHDLRQIIEVVRKLRLPTGIVINRDGSGSSSEVEQLCRDCQVPILLRIPLDRRISEGMARGEPLVSLCPEYIAEFQWLHSTMLKALEERKPCPA